MLKHFAFKKNLKFDTLKLMDVTSFLQENFRYIIGFHLVGIVLGFGGALMADIFFFRFLKDRKITEEEVRTLRVFSRIIWVGLAIIVFSGLLLFLSSMEFYLNSAKFLTKMAVVGVIVVNGLVLNFAVTPKLTSINFIAKENEDKKMHNVRSLAFASGAVSAVSWWTAFILGVLQFSLAPFPIMFGSYLIILAVAVLVSQAVCKLFISGKINIPDII